ncbi:hypothetical protein [Pseudomonas sp. NA-150]|uniref:hypothetical protein n=1 Tax=Pseudomonas sp. NA-150 TaxID=3367525 RepID=UPI0037C6114F
MSNQHSNTDRQPPTHKERFAEACKTTEFTPHAASPGFVVWDVQHVRDGQKVNIDGPFFTEDEARISADLLRGTFRGARAQDVNWFVGVQHKQIVTEHCVASRTLLARQLGVVFTPASPTAPSAPSGA